MHRILNLIILESSKLKYSIDRKEKKEFKRKRNV